ncbi:TlyA family RNA methyltransferase [Collinsella sp. zg1085]|uniref:TlyA family RNA methyltransferase n=1 Tax=Collinsella sp. zg1085 TaxID=2844380 RepID=UPI001C0C58B3|nr:TlyA family RNA methyltransferase [Collinsella sp. zg1085]QWT17077.1 TlyA family RNA methyltransferase [Collinsella sp. zg1085]
MARVRLDDELVAQGICRDRAQALRLILAGSVSAEGERLSSAGMLVRPGLSLHVKTKLPYVGRGGLKLEGALDGFGLSPAGMNCLDIGCSTGGFTDCLLKRGARSVIAVDVGKAQFDWNLRNDERVILLEKTNIRTVPTLGYHDIDFAVCDVSFTRISTILPAVCELLSDAGIFVTLVKPQFEAEVHEVGIGGVIRDPHVWHTVLARVINSFVDAGLIPMDICVSPILGAKGNREYFLWGSCQAHLSADAVCARVSQLIEKGKQL